MTLQEGAVIAGRFVVERLAGEGGMGSVYRAKDRDRGDLVAVKVFHEAATSPEEARVLLELAHPSIVRCVAFGKAGDGRAYIATEWLDGETLRLRLERGPLPVAETMRIARRIADGLAAAHGWGIVHRDVTPANVMLVGDDVKLLDFGLAVHGRKGAAAGTVGYAAPEQARGDRASPRADVFSLGCVMVECVTGEKPFAADTDVAVMARMLERDTAHVTTRLKGVPEALVRLLGRMLATDPDVRPHDGAAVAAELVVLAGPTPSPAVDIRRDSNRATRSSVSVTNAEARASQMLLAVVESKDPHRITQELEKLGARVAWSQETKLACTWATETSAVERAVRGARAAISMRRWSARARVALVCGASDTLAREAAEDALPDTPAIRVDTDTARLLGDRFVVRPDGDDLVLVRESESPHSRTTLLGRETQCVGRDREIALIASVFDECRDEPDARVVWVTGAPGIGKTRVRDEVLARIAKDPAARVWSAQADPTRASVAFGVLGDLVRSAASIAPGDDEGYQRAAIAERVCARVPVVERSRVVDFLGELLRLHDGGSVSLRTPSFDAQTPSDQLRAAREEPLLMGDQLRRAASDLVLAELADGPLVLVIEDLQWADAGSVRAISDIARVARDKPLFVLLVGRPEAKDTAIRLVADRQPTGVALGKLGTKAMERLVALALGCDPSDPRVASTAERAGGNPFFAEEIVRAARAGDAAPAAALAMLEARLVSVEPEARRVLRAGSVFGQQFTSGDVAMLLGDDASEPFVSAWCSWLVEREILVQTGTHAAPDEGTLWAFRHALVRDAAYAMLTDTDRAAAHALAAETLERAARVPSPVIAEHWSRAGQPARAARWLATSAGEALEANDLSACVDLGQRALGALAEDATDARAQLLVVLAEAHRWRGDYERAVSCARAALVVLPEGAPLFFRAAAELASLAGTIGPAEELETAIRRLITVHDVRGDAASIAWSRAAMQLLVRNDPRADALLERARTAADTDLARGRLEQSYALRAGIRGDLEELMQRYQASFGALERAGDARGACIQELNLASALCELGLPQAREHLTHGRRVAEASGLASAIALAHHLEGILLGREGHTAEAISAQRRALETFAAQGNARMEGGVRCHLAELLLARARSNEAALAEARSEAERADRLLTAVPPARARALATLALVHVARGDDQAALAASAEALAIAEEGGVDTGESLVYWARAEALALAGSPEADVIRARGRQRLASRAQAITDATVRRAFLDVPENAIFEVLDGTPVPP